MMDGSAAQVLVRDEPTVEEPRSRAERRDQQVQRILEAAKACFVRSGFQGASMHEICAGAGMSPGALYRYFPSKEAIVEAITLADRKQDAECLHVLDAALPPFEALVGALMAHVRFLHESGNAPMFVEIRAESMRNEAVRRSVMQCMGDVEVRLRAFLADAIAGGALRPVLELDALLPVLMAIGEGVAMSDLPARGVPLEAVEAAMRASLAALLRPAENARQG